MLFFDKFFPFYDKEGTQTKEYGQYYLGDKIYLVDICGVSEKFNLVLRN